VALEASYLPLVVAVLHSATTLPTSSTGLGVGAAAMELCKCSYKALLSASDLYTHITFLYSENEGFSLVRVSRATRLLKHTFTNLVPMPLSCVELGVVGFFEVLFCGAVEVGIPQCRGPTSRQAIGVRVAQMTSSVCLDTVAESVLLENIPTVVHLLFRVLSVKF
jgi:hypothetical protein